MQANCHWLRQDNSTSEKHFNAYRYGVFERSGMGNSNTLASAGIFWQNPDARENFGLN